MISNYILVSAKAKSALSCVGASKIKAFQGDLAQSLHHLANYKIDHVNSDSMITAKADTLDPPYIDPVGLRIDSTHNDTQTWFTYRISLTRNSDVIHQQVFESGEPWGFMAEWQHDMPAEICLVLESLKKCKDAFKVQYRNGILDFQDKKGTGIFRLFSDVTEHFWVETRETALVVEIVSIFKEIVHKISRSDAEIRVKTSVSFINMLLVVQKACSTYLKLKGNMTEALNQIDWVYVWQCIRELDLMYYTIFEHVIHMIDKKIDAKIRQSDLHTPDDNEVGNELAHITSYGRFKSFLIHIHTISHCGYLEGSDMLDSLYHLQDIDDVIDSMPSLMPLLFDSQVICRMRDKIRPMKTRVYGYYARSIKDIKMTVSKGYVWRFSVWFMRMVRQVMLKKMIGIAHGKFSIAYISAARHGYAQSKDGCIYFDSVGSYEIRVCEKEILWYKTTCDLTNMLSMVLKTQYVPSGKNVIRVGHKLVIFAKSSKIGYEDVSQVILVNLTPLERSEDPNVIITPVKFFKLCCFTNNHHDFLVVAETEDNQKKYSIA